jgi:SAM-dependent methyltransferase
VLAKLRRAAASPRARAAVYKVADKLPPSASRALLRAGRRARDAVSTSPARASGIAGARKPPPKRFRVSPAPAPIVGDWPEPPEIHNANEAVQSIYETGAKPLAFDIELFDELQREYESKPLVPKPPGRDETSRSERARRRLAMVHDSIGLADNRVLEFGCGAGYEIWYLSHHMGADAYGVDVVERGSWSALADERTHYECADLTQKNPFPENFFDRVMSFSVFEHVAHPYKALQELHSIMKPGGLAWISANLHRSAVASHLYHDIYFPFPHLLFTDEVISEFYRRRGERPRGASWVNKLTWNHYERYFGMVGFDIKMLRFSERDLDEEFYERFEDVLGRYPKWDLTKDFFNVIVQKPL